MPGILLTAIIAGFGLVSYWGNRRAAARTRSFRALVMAQRTAGLMLVSVGDLAPLLGLGCVELVSWAADGVPTRHQRAVAELFRATVALRRRFPAESAWQLLAVRARRRAAMSDAHRLVGALSRTSRQGHISVTLR